MMAVSLVLALVLDRISPALHGFRLDYRFQAYTNWFLKQSWYRYIPARLLPYALISPAVIIVGISGNIMRFSGIFELAFNILIAFVCLKPQVLNEEVDDILNDLNKSKTFYQREVEEIFGESNRSLFSIIFWMVIVGPVWVVAFRLLISLVSTSTVPGRDSWHKDVGRIISWIEWLPGLISSYLFMLCGSFEAGIKASKGLPVIGENVAELNEIRLKHIGLAVVDVEISASTLLTVDIMRRIRGMLLRTLVVWLVLAAIIDYWL